MEGNITESFTWKEVLFSDTANKLIAEGKLTREQTQPNEEQRKNIQFLFDKIVQPIRIAYGKPLKINSVFRAPAVNALIGGSKTSDHMCSGGTAACDLESVDPAFSEEFTIWLWKNRLKYPIKQLVIEFPDTNGVPQWNHISCDRLDNTPDMQMLMAVKQDGKTVYLPANDMILKKYSIGI